MKSTRQWGEKMWSVSSCIVWYRHVKSHCKDCKVAVSFDIFSVCNDVELAVRLTRCHAFPPEIWVLVPFISGTQNCTVCVFKTVESVESLKPTLHQLFIKLDSLEQTWKEKANGDSVVYLCDLHGQVILESYGIILSTSVIPEFSCPRREWTTTTWLNSSLVGEPRTMTQGLT